MGTSSRQIAKRYLHDQIEIMKKHGKAPKLDAARTKEVLADIQASFESLRGATSERKIKAI